MKLILLQIILIILSFIFTLTHSKLNLPSQKQETTFLLKEKDISTIIDEGLFKLDNVEERILSKIEKIEKRIGLSKSSKKEKVFLESEDLTDDIVEFKLIMNNNLKAEDEEVTANINETSIFEKTINRIKSLSVMKSDLSLFMNNVFNEKYYKCKINNKDFMNGILLNGNNFISLERSNLVDSNQFTRVQPS